MHDRDRRRAWRRAGVLAALTVLFSVCFGVSPAAADSPWFVQVTGLRVVGVTATSVELAWDPVAELPAAGYRVSVDEPGHSYYTGSHDPGMVIPWLAEQTEYTVRVAAWDGTTAAPDSEPVTFTTLDGWTPSAPTAPSVTEITETSALIGWQPPADPGNALDIDYLIQIDNADPAAWPEGNGGYGVGDAVAVTSLRVQLFRPGFEYAVRIWARSSFGSSPPLEFTFRTAGGAAPEPPVEAAPVAPVPVASVDVPLAALPETGASWERATLPAAAAVLVGAVLIAAAGLRRRRRA